MASKKPASERMDHAEAQRILTDLWSRMQVEAQKAATPQARAERMREVEALSIAMTTLEVVKRLGG